MKKIFSLLFLIVLLSANFVSAEEELDYSQYCQKKSTIRLAVNDEKAIKDLVKNSLLFSNSRQIDKLYNLYSANYVSSDGFNRDVYFDLIKKTCEMYPNIKHKFEIKNITINGNQAIVDVVETAKATSYEKIENKNVKGNLYSVASVVYYIEKEQGEWKIVSDFIMNEQTKLLYGSAVNAFIEFSTPNQVLEGKEYTSSLKVLAPLKMLAIGSITQENITYPQYSAEEIFKKIPSDGVLERMFVANKANLNEYNVASIGLTKILQQNKVNTVYVTGLGYIINRVNVRPFNNFEKAVVNEQKDQK